ncbi:hypothetical protein EZV62_019253 [Acer yangbiense]|uniref:Uncharacterized protein n=1 Tax=Acer yangbiense TaxID=1000413 RepID=A0A5C7HAT8_9ROSI|nr:hypothetical protein EZV62_019253 [Acer yangbiense]
MLSAIQLMKTPSSPTSSKNIKPVEGVPKKRRRATSGKKQPSPTKGGIMNANPLLPQCQPVHTKLKEPTRYNARLTPNPKAILHERFPKSKYTHSKEPTCGRLQLARRTRDEDVVKEYKILKNQVVRKLNDTDSYSIPLR